MKTATQIPHSFRRAWDRQKLWFTEPRTTPHPYTPPPKTWPQSALDTPLIKHCLESQAAQHDGPLYPKVAHNSSKVVQNCRPLTFQVLGPFGIAGCMAACSIGLFAGSFSAAQGGAPDLCNAVVVGRSKEEPEVRRDFRTRGPYYAYFGKPSSPKEEAALPQSSPVLEQSSPKHGLLAFELGPLDSFVSKRP